MQKKRKKKLWENERMLLLEMEYKKGRGKAQRETDERSKVCV